MPKPLPQIPKPKPLTTPQILELNAQLESSLKFAKQQLKNYKSLYKTTKSHLQAAKREIESLKLDLRDSTSTAEIQRPKRPQNAVPPIKNIQISSFQVLKPPPVTHEQYQALTKHNMKLQDEVTRLKQQRQQLLAEQEQLFRQIQERDGAGNAFEQEKARAALERDNEILIRELRKLDRSKAQLEGQVATLQAQTEREFQGAQEDVGGYERIIKDLERQLFASQQNFTAIQEEAQYRIESSAQQLNTLQKQLLAVQHTPRTTNSIYQKLVEFRENELISAASGVGTERLNELEQKLLFRAPEVLHFVDQNWSEKLKMIAISLFGDDYLAGIFVAGGGMLNDAGMYEVNGVVEQQEEHEEDGID
ncbi:hypothetical protein SS50377_22853 [Spironucleus salmonicida]|uniref:Uncharacterized protein n=1 Tax=Spironucleus salmonicida TaxID=348837 RepID=V6LW28_9EUKA|nr:hypothetical protein SS50377_22853 [Spironucleus salmonicida]|eukprot:EST47911.1 Hypothetical protein SS50377_12017 [Spironucleus salmonicida]